MGKSNLDWENSCLFALADIGDVNLFEYWLDKKNLNIDLQDEDGDTPLHHAAKRGHIELVIELLKRGAVISLNKKKHTALVDAYTNNHTKIAKEITKFIIQRNSIKKIIQIQNFNKIDTREQQKLNQLVNDFIKYLRKNYLDRNIFIRFPAKHTERAKALTVAVRRCSSIKEFRDLLNNQLNLFNSSPVRPLSKEIIDKRWSEVIKNKPFNVNNSHFYKSINSFVIEKFSTADRTNKSCSNSALQ